MIKRGYNINPQILSKYEVSSNSISHWKTQFLSNAAIAFEPAKVVSGYQAQINKLRASKSFRENYDREGLGYGKAKKRGFIK